MTDSGDQHRARRLQRKNWIMLLVLVGFAVSVTAYTFIHILSEMNMTAPGTSSIRQ